MVEIEQSQGRAIFGRHRQSFQKIEQVLIENTQKH